MELEFINVTRLGVDDSNRRRIRAHVQRDFRRKEHHKKNTFEIPLRTDKPQPRERNKAQDTALLLPEPHLVPSIHSPAVCRIQYLQPLADSWFPVADFRYSSMFKTIVDTFYAHGSPINASVDATKLMHVGTTAKDERLILEARKRSHVVINGLRLDMSRKVPTMGLASVLLSGLGTLTMEIYAAYTNTSTWHNQALGMSYLAVTRSRDNMDFLLENFALKQIRILQLLYALDKRVTFPKKLAIPVIPTHSLFLDSLLDLAFEVPSLLEASDFIIADALCQPDIHLIASLATQQKALLAWLERFNVSKPRGPTGQNSTSRTPLFDHTCESLCLTCLLLVSQTLEDLNSCLQPKTSSSSSLPVGSSGAYATALRQTAMLLAETAGAPVCKARTISGPLHFLKKYYARAGDGAGLEWCEDFKGSVVAEVPYLRWDALLAWTYMTLTWVPT